MKCIMKKSIILTGAVIALSFAAISCEKEAVNNFPDTSGKVHMTIIASGDAGTKTVLQSDGKTVLWDNEEQLAVLEVIEGAEGTTTSYAASSDGVSEDEGTTMTFGVDFNKNFTGTSYTYYALYPNSSYVTSTNTDPEALKVITPSTQKATATSFDGDADLLIARPVTETSQQTNLNLAFKRMVVVGKMTLTDVDTDGYVKSVKFSSTDKVITGKSKLNLNAGEAVEYGYDGTGNKVDYVEVTYAANDIPANGLTVYFTCLPFEINAGEKFTVTLTTKDDLTFTREVTIPEGRKLSFAVGKNTVFSVNMSSATSGENASLAGKDYVIVGRQMNNNVPTGDFAYMTSTLASNSAGTSTFYPSVSTSVSASDEIDVTNSKVDFSEVEDYWRIETKGDNYAIKSVSTGKYIGWSSENTAIASDSAYELRISAVEGTPGMYQVFSVADGTRRLQYNAQNTRFAFYTGTQQDVFLIPVGEDVAQATLLSISVSGQTTTFNLGDTFTFDGTVTATYDDGTTKNVTSKATVSTPDMTTVGTKTVTVSFEDQTVTYDITVNEKTIVYPVTDVLTLSTTGVSGTSYADWSDKTVSSLAKYSGNSAGSYSSIQLRKTSPSGIVTTVSGGYATKVTVTWESNTVAGRKLNVYGKSSAYSSPADLYSNDDAGTLIGTIVNGESTELVIPYDCKYIGLRSNEGAMYLSEIQIIWSDTASGNPIPTPTYNVIIADNITNGTVTASKTTGIEAGESITLTVNANSNYQLQSLTVDGSDVSDSVDAEGKYTFTMPSRDVSVGASFISTQSSGESETITSGTFSGEKTGISMTTASGITISQLKVDGADVNTSYNTVSTLRVYRANEMQFTGKTFTRIEMYYTGSYSGAEWSVQAGGGTVTIDTSKKKVVWENASGASSVTLKNSTASGTNTQLRTTQFVVTFN